MLASYESAMAEHVNGCCGDELVAQAIVSKQHVPAPDVQALLAEIIVVLIDYVSASGHWFSATNIFKSARLAQFSCASMGSV